MIPVSPGHSCSFPCRQYKQPSAKRLKLQKWLECLQRSNRGNWGQGWQRWRILFYCKNCLFELDWFKYVMIARKALSVLENLVVKSERDGEVLRICSVLSVYWGNGDSHVYFLSYLLSSCFKAKMGLAGWTEETANRKSVIVVRAGECTWCFRDLKWRSG